MSRIFLHIVCYVAVAASVALWPVTDAYSLRPTMPPSSTFNPKGTPCEGVRCPSGRHCELNENNEASCVCDGNCYDYYNPLCGSDNITYSSNCELIREACKTNRNISIIYYGPCQNEGSICIGITCPSNRVCAVAGGRATCVCSQNCPAYSNPVCGSDNRTYISDCDLRRHSCMTNVNIMIAYYAECKQETACNQFSCPNGMQCAIDERHNPVCVCAETCPYATDIVCGTDGRTYGSECELFKKACTSADNIRVAYKGYCLEGTVCSGHRCPSNKQCNVNEYNQPVCICNQYCPYEYSPICGSDGVTYSNLCELKRQACITGINITLARSGKCVYDEYCYGVTCPRPMSCVVDAENQTSCACNNKCEGYDGYYYPVCGSDNKTYDNYCQFNYVVCQTNISSAFYYGVCPEGPNCQGIYCGDGKHCDSEHQPEPKCVCNTDCPKTYNPICGSNNKTYNNTCELQKDACLTNTSITEQFNGKCDEGPGCRYTYCPYDKSCVVDERNRPICVCSQYCSGGSTEVCGSDNKTYTGDCFRMTAACMTNKTITLRQYGQCTTEADSPCSGVVCPSEKYCKVGPRGRPICVCNEVCPSYGSPVCGSDNRTYSNYCQLRKQACLSSSSILWLYYGRCVEASTCDRISCPQEKRCAVDDENQPMCVCIDECLSVQSPVCGSDGLTYINDCELQKAACLSNRNTTLAHRGKCDKGLTCSDISCPTGRTCALDERNQPTCVCNTDCSSSSYYYNPVCGTDGKTYSSECYLQRDACTTDTNIKVDYYGICRSDVSPSTTTTNRGCVGPSCTTTTTTFTP